MESGINGRALDFAKLGQLFLNGGRRNGRAVVPDAWVQAATRLDPAVDRARYYQGQIVFVWPEKRLVMVRHGERYGVEAGWLDLFVTFADHWQE